MLNITRRFSLTLLRLSALKLHKELPMKLYQAAFILTTVMATLCISTSALAGGDSGFYIGGSIGQASLDVDTIETNNFAFDDSDNAYKIMLGFNVGVLPLIDLGIEAAYRDLGSFEGNIGLDNFAPGGNSEIDFLRVSSIDAIDVFGILTLNMGPIGVFGKVGFIDWEVDTNLADLNVSRSGSDAAYGLGAQLRFGSFAVRAEYELFEIDSAADDIEMLSVGLSYTF